MNRLEKLRALQAAIREWLQKQGEPFDTRDLAGRFGLRQLTAKAGRQFGGLIDGWISVFDDTLHRFRDYCGQHRDDAKRRPA